MKTTYDDNWVEERIDPGPRPAPLPPARQLAAPPVRRRILVADDDYAVRLSLANVLASEGYEAILAHNGRETLRQFREQRPDLVLLDLNMPARDGWQVLQDLNRLDPVVPVIVITARPHQLERALGEGVDAFMEKPLDLDALLASIAEFVSQSASARLAYVTNKNFTTRLLPSAELTPPRKQAA